MRWLRHLFLCKKLIKQLQEMKGGKVPYETYFAVWCQWADLHKITFGKPWPGGGNCRNTPKYIPIKKDSK